jgi:predicted RecA/RadA family phage recombinase
MANNEVIPLAETLTVVVTDPASPAAGDPCRFGSLTGVAVTSIDGTLTTVDISMKVWDLPVFDHGGGGIAVGDALFYDDGQNRIENDAAGYFFGFALEAVANGQLSTINVLHVPSPGAGSVGAGTVGAAALAANAVETAKILNGNVTLAKLAAESVDGSKLAEAAASSVIGAVPILYHTTIPDVGAPTNYDITVTSKIHVVDAWIVNLAAGHATDDTLQLSNTAAAITDAIKKTATDHKVVHATTIDHANADIANGGILRWTATKATNCACEAYVQAYRVA